MNARPSDECLSWIRRLIGFKTVSNDSNLALIHAIADHLRSLHVPIRLTYNDDRTKANILATIGPEKPGGLVLSGHTDTVPWEGQTWSRSPTESEVVELGGESRLFGRGSADMKGFIGCVVAQSERWLAADLPYAIHYAFSYDEEVGCLGAQRLVADLQRSGLAPKLCVVGEPTGMVPAVAHKGAFRWRCCVRGRAVHSSQSPAGVNAIEAASRVINHIAALTSRWRTKERHQPGFEVPHSTAAVCQIQGGIADNIVPQDCWFNYEFRLLPGSSHRQPQREIEDLAESLENDMKTKDASSWIRFEPIIEVPSFQARTDDLAVTLALNLTGEEAPIQVDFGTEAGLFQQAGLSTVVCGPGSIGQAHQADEYVTLDQLARCERFLRALDGASLGWTG